ncbi:MAG: tail fiber domain-containing protein [Bacteroidia bacterium]
MKYYRFSIALIVAFTLSFSLAFAQVNDTGDKVGIGIPGATSAQLFGKLDVRGDNIFLTPTANLFPNFPNQFIGVGQSGGSCSLYGFRAQYRSGSNGNFINMGVRRDDATGIKNPIISWGGCAIPKALPSLDDVVDPLPVSFCQRRNLDFLYDENNGGCGDLIARMSRGTYKLTVYGQARFNGNIRVNTTTYTSDSRFKKDIAPLTNAMSLISQIQGHSYNFRTNEFPDYNFADGLHFGFLAQELKEVAPNLVEMGEDGYYAVDYVSLVPVLVEALKEKDTQINAIEETVNQQQEDINFLKEELARLASSIGADQAPVDGKRVGSVGVESPVLFQNAPNPFRELTTLRAFIPAEVKQANIIIYDLQGKEVQRKAVEARGMTEVLINGSTLAAGTYLYSLIADEITIDTKRMTLTN